MAVHQDIRFCNSADGVQLAIALYSQGPPLVKAETWLTHIEAAHSYFRLVEAVIGRQVTKVGCAVVCPARLAQCSC